VELLLSAGANKDSLSEDNCTPVYYAVLGKHYGIVKLLIDQNCDIQQADLEGTSPLHGSVMVGSLDTCKMLVGAGADTTVKDKLGRKPADLAKEFGFIDLLNYLNSCS